MTFRETFQKYNKLIAFGLFLLLFVAVLMTRFISGNATIFNGTLWSLVPPFLAIAMALITKEVYSSLFAGVLLGGIMASGCSFAGTITGVTVDGLSTAVADNAGIFVFLVLLGIVVAIVNKSGASKAFGNWASSHIHSKAGATFATFVLGVLIFIDDYFNCLTVGSVMNPVTDNQRISRVKMAYIIDATAAPVCMIAPVSSWAAAFSGVVESETYTGIQLFIRAIPYNFYSLFTFAFIIILTILGFDYGKMADFEIKAQQTGDLGILDTASGEADVDDGKKRSIWDLLAPIIVLIIACVAGMLLVGGFFTQGEGNYLNLIGAFGDTDAFVGLPWGGIIALLVVMAYMLIRRLLNFDELMGCIKDGFIAMVPAITILTLATSLKNMTGLLDTETFITNLMAGAGNLMWLLPALVFVLACLIAFSTGTSWGTFGILVPLVVLVFPEGNSLFFVGISACLAGAVCGDHCSPISDTTIMASAGAQCNHIEHVETQLPYAITVAAISFVTYLLAGLFSLFTNPIIALPIGVVLTFGVLLFIKKKMPQITTLRNENNKL